MKPIVASAANKMASALPADSESPRPLNNHELEKNVAKTGSAALGFGVITRIPCTNP